MEDDALVDAPPEFIEFFELLQSVCDLSLHIETLDLAYNDLLTHFTTVMDSKIQRAYINREKYFEYLENCDAECLEELEDF